MCVMGWARHAAVQAYARQQFIHTAHPTPSAGRTQQQPLQGAYATARRMHDASTVTEEPQSGFGHKTVKHTETYGGNTSSAASPAVLVSMRPGVQLKLDVTENSLRSIDEQGTVLAAASPTTKGLASVRAPADASTGIYLMSVPPKFA